jgi:hypothetical protein
MTTITTTPSGTSTPHIGRGPLIVGAAVVGLAVFTILTVPRLTSSTIESASTSGSTTVVTTSRAGGPDALELHQRSGSVGTRTGTDAERHFFGGGTSVVVTSPGLLGPHALDPRAWTRTVDSSALAPGGSVYQQQVPTVSQPDLSAYAPGGSVYQQQVPSVPQTYQGPTSADAAEQWTTGTPVPKRGYR